MGVTICQRDHRARSAYAPAFPDRTLSERAFNFSSISPVAIFAITIAPASVSAGARGQDERGAEIGNRDAF